MHIKKQIAKLKWRFDWYRGKTKPAPPYFINIEPTNICNLQCTICSLDKSRKPGYMEMDLYRDIIEKAVAFNITELRLFLAGEPLLNKKIVQMIEFAKKENLITTIHTNATTLTEDLGNRIINAGLDILSISFHGENKLEYESIMQGADYDKVLNNVIKFLDLKQEKLKNSDSHQSKNAKIKPEVIIQVVKSSPRDSLILEPGFKAKFRGLPVDRFIVLHPHNWAGEINLNTDTSRKQYFQCQHLYQSMSIAYNGDVYACCGDLNGRMIIDNVRNKTLEEIWHSDKLCEMRDRLKRGKYKEYSLCSSCDVLWRRRHPLFTDIASLLKLQGLKNRFKYSNKK